MFGFFKRSLEKTAQLIASIGGSSKRDTVSKEELEEMLVAADMDYDLVERLLEPLSGSINRLALSNSLSLIFAEAEAKPVVGFCSKAPFVDLVIGVNGAGKTTTIAKLANKAKKEGKSVLLGAGDTFRAAAVEQLTIWAKRLDVPIVSAKTGGDPSAVAFDTINSALSKNIDYCIIDTAGRLHTQHNLSEELKKIVRVCDKALEGSPHRKIAILDGTSGKSAVAQAKAFDSMIGLDGVIVTKLDGTAKGGAIFSIVDSLKLPVLYLGLGEGADDLVEFSSKAYIDGLLDAIYVPNES